MTDLYPTLIVDTKPDRPTWMVLAVDLTGSEHRWPASDEFHAEAWASVQRFLHPDRPVVTYPIGNPSAGLPGCMDCWDTGVVPPTAAARDLVTPKPCPKCRPKLAAFAKMTRGATARCNFNPCPICGDQLSLLASCAKPQCVAVSNRSEVPLERRLDDAA